MRSLLCAAFIVLLASSSAAQDLTRNRLEADIRFLADDLLEGRGTPGPGLEIAARYLAGELQKHGWAPGNGASYMQQYPIMRYRGRDAKSTLRIDGVEVPKEDFIFVPGSFNPAHRVEARASFVGRGIDYPEKGIRDYSGVDVAGRAVVAFSGAPWPIDSNVFFGPDQFIGKVISASSRGARLLVLVTPDLQKDRDAIIGRAIGRGEVAYLPDFSGRPTSGLGSAVVISASAFDRHLAKASGRTYAAWQQALAKKGAKKGASILAKSIVELDVAVTPESSLAPNVVAMLEGADPLLKNEWIVLTAHYDHLGSSKDKDGKTIVMNGADDNASGCAAVLEVARRLAAGPRPKRSVLVLLVSGEERGLLGSAHYSHHPLVPYERVVANINVDMVGRSDGSVQAITQSPELFRLAFDLGAREGIKVLDDQQVSWRVAYLTDSYHFSRFGIPAVEFFTGMHDDYHGAGDDADKIRFAELASIMTVMHGVTRTFADGAPRVAVKRPEWYVTQP